jgi:hypothetical protein
MSSKDKNDLKKRLAKGILLLVGASLLLILCGLMVIDVLDQAKNHEALVKLSTRGDPLNHPPKKPDTLFIWKGRMLAICMGAGGLFMLIEAFRTLRPGKSSTPTS